MAPSDGSRPLPAWPVDVLLWGFPVFWLLGLSPFAPIGLAMIMAGFMIVRRGETIVPGMLPWFAFVLWIVPAAQMLDSPLRLLGYGLRFANLAAIAVVLLYVVSAREQLSIRRVLAGLTVVWLTVVVGGYLGTLWPDVRLSTPAGLLLPGALAGNEYVQDLVFPPFAEVQRPWGAPEPFVRPAAPFPYANSWGTAVVLLTPLAIAGLRFFRSKGARRLIVVGLAALVPPALASSNRGMFIGLGIAVGYVVLRLAGRGQVKTLLAVVSTGGLVVGVFVYAGLLDSIATRQEYSDTTSGRASLYEETFTRTLESPLLGWGAPRPSLVHGISVGTQGHVWMVMFSYGFVGLALFLLFLWGATLRTWFSACDTGRLWMHSCLVTASVLIFFYGLDTMQMLAVVLVAGLLLRERYGADEVRT
ncbi:O-antigen ligase family protein [Phytoactinopolyspora mesophila]|uniref:O-antigen ligase domain-containing protein n=1 Tax=Phytoactinopolyspora mesophila TaxID=2650750 RepID=A0A7K3M6J4_9ACTN|nr:O-antigen ligase domain-containing protein [Phytoactinopolyspora mesophila]NDL58512.1 O-antigen ligase domain-containing protein [Phytoactinopolyspora mesophila]